MGYTVNFFFRSAVADAKIWTMRQKIAADEKNDKVTNLTLWQQSKSK